LTGAVVDIGAADIVGGAGTDVMGIGCVVGDFDGAGIGAASFADRGDCP
jgi:hypothetical protein